MTAALFETPKSTILLLRWVVIVTASYLVLFGHDSTVSDRALALFVAVFLGSNLVVARIPEPAFGTTRLRAGLVLFDTACISLGMYLAGENSSELFLLYFSVLFLAALGESEGMIAAGCALIGLLYLTFLLRTQSTIVTAAVLLRFPFLFGIATFYGYLVSVAKRERRAADLARMRERDRTDLLATLTHDLRTPLCSIVSLAGILSEDESVLDPAERQQILRDVKKVAMDGIELVGSFLAMASMEAPKATAREWLDLNAIVRDASRPHERTILEKQIRLEHTFAERLPPILGDRAQLGRAVSNLVSNAIKVVDRGGWIELVTAQEADAVTCAVRDDGPGVPEAVRERLFEPYVSKHDREPGTGLGLFIVRQVAEAHGGSVAVFSQPGRGATFVLRVPILAGDALPDAETLTPRPETNPSPHRTPADARSSPSGHSAGSGGATSSRGAR